MDKQRAALKPLPPQRDGFVIALGDESLSAEELGALLRRLRDATGVPQGELADRSGILYQNLSRLEHGRREIAIATLNRYVRGLGLELLLVARPRTG